MYSLQKTSFSLLFQQIKFNRIAGRIRLFSEVLLRDVAKAKLISFAIYLLLKQGIWTAFNLNEVIAKNFFTSVTSYFSTLTISGFVSFLGANTRATQRGKKNDPKIK